MFSIKSGNEETPLATEDSCLPKQRMSMIRQLLEQNDTVQHPTAKLPHINIETSQRYRPITPKPAYTALQVQPLSNQEHAVEPVKTTLRLVPPLILQRINQTSQEQHKIFKSDAIQRLKRLKQRKVGETEEFAITART